MCFYTYLDWKIEIKYLGVTPDKNLIYGHTSPTNTR